MLEPLLAALLDTPEKQHAYRNNARFHATLTVIAEVIGEVVDLMAQGAAEENERFRAEAWRLMNTPALPWNARAPFTP